MTKNTGLRQVYAPILCLECGIASIIVILLFLGGDLLLDQIAQWPTISVPRGELAFLRIKDGKQAAVGTQPWRTMVVWPSGHGYNIGIPTYNAERARQLAQHLYGGGSLTDRRANNYLFLLINKDLVR